MKRAQVFRLSMAHPGDLSALEALITGGTVRAADVVAIIGKTEGNGGVNDFTRGYFTQTLMALLSAHLKRPASQLIKEIPCVLSGGTEGVMSPHYSVFCVSESRRQAEYGSSLAIGTAYEPVAAEDVGRSAHVESVACTAAGDHKRRDRETGGRAFRSGQMSMRDGGGVQSAAIAAGKTPRTTDPNSSMAMPARQAPSESRSRSASSIRLDSTMIRCS